MAKNKIKVQVKPNGSGAGKPVKVEPIKAPIKIVYKFEAPIK